MPKYCVKDVGGLVKNYGKLGVLSPQSTDDPNCLTSQAIFTLSFRTASAHPASLFTQLKSAYFNLLIVFLNPSSTTPTNKTII